MSRRIIPMVGRRFGSLKVLRQEGRTNAGKLQYVCECLECGKITNPIDGRDLRRGTTKSCGCGKAKYGDKLKSKKLYAIWNYMKVKCNSLKCKDYPAYGGRGIKVCDEWENDYLVFQEWALNNGYKPDIGLTIDRRDNDKGYSPSNCRWVSMKVQGLNKRNNIWITLDGVTKTVSQWAEELGISSSTIHYHFGKEDVYDWIRLKLIQKEKVPVPASTFSFVAVAATL